MALKLYHDSNGDNEITESDPDEVKEAVAEGSDLSDETVIYLMSDDDSLTYENIEITQTEIEWEDGEDYEVGESVLGSDDNNYMCTQDHTADSDSEPDEGADWEDYWREVNDVTVEYAEDDNGDPDTYEDPLSLPDGDYGSAVDIHRRAEASDITEAFKKTNIRHQLSYDEYVQ